VASEVAALSQRQTLWSLVDRLEDKYRLPVILHYHEGWPCGDVAGILSLRTSTVYSRLNTARIQLRTMLHAESRQGIERSKVRNAEKV
jgi:RNA polymerase sigma-70 factor (ECF subfamily)